MTLRLVVSLALFLAAMPAAAVLKTYALDGDQSNLFPTCGTVFHPGAVSGTAAIEETGNGAPTLVELELQIDWAQQIGYVGIPGASMVVTGHRVMRPEPLQSGTGSTTTTIEWDALTGWTHTGWTSCTTFLPEGTPPPSACIPFIGFEGTGAPAPLSSSAFDTDPWTFSGNGFHFEAAPVDYVDLGAGLIVSSVVWRGDLEVPIPTLSLFGVGVLGAALLYLGARALGR